MTMMTEERLVEGTQEDRSEFLDRVQVLDKVKKITLLSSEQVTVMSAVADYYEVAYDAIKN